MSMWTIPLAVAVVAGLALVFIDPERCRTSRVIARAVTVGGWWLASAGLLAWIVVSWPRTTRNLGLAYSDKHAVKRIRTINNRGVMTEKEHPRITYPLFLPRLDAYGVVLAVWPRVGVARRDWDEAAEHLANAWRCRRVHVSQHKPGRLTVRALRRDPLAARLDLPTPSRKDNDDEDRDLDQAA